MRTNPSHVLDRGGIQMFGAIFAKQQAAVVCIAYFVYLNPPRRTLPLKEITQRGFRLKWPGEMKNANIILDPFYINSVTKKNPESYSQTSKQQQELFVYTGFSESA